MTPDKGRQGLFIQEKHRGTQMRTIKGRTNKEAQVKIKKGGETDTGSTVQKIQGET